MGQINEMSQRKKSQHTSEVGRARRLTQRLAWKSDSAFNYNAHNAQVLLALTLVF